jgi:hypothetical protein
VTCVTSRDIWHAKENFATVTWHVHSSFVFEPWLFLPQSTPRELSKHVIEALARHGIALFYWFEDSEGANIVQTRPLGEFRQGILCSELVQTRPTLSYSNVLIFLRQGCLTQYFFSIRPLILLTSFFVVCRKDFPKSYTSAKEQTQ